MKLLLKSQNKKWLFVCTVALYICCSSCKKQDDWLNVKRQNSDVVPTTLQDFQAILDQSNQMNKDYPQIGLLSTDNVYINDANLDANEAIGKNAYLFAVDVYQGQSCYDWDLAYAQIESANIVLDGLTKIDPKTVDNAAYNNVKGSALFFRSFLFYELAQLFSKPYDAGSAASDLGIPVRLTSDVNVPSVRATVKDTYQQILTDLQTAVALLPVTPLYKTRPSQVAANALLAKVYLSMQDFTNAGKYVNTALTAYSTLLDYNSSQVIPTSTYPFPAFSPGNPEVIFYAETGGSYSTLYPAYIPDIDTTLYKSYAINDLRKSLFYTDLGGGQITFQGTYAADGYDFGGIATDELLLIRAECSARAGNTQAAMTDLNNLLIKRWKTGTFIPYTAASSEDALGQVLNERRKELVFTGMLRWEDLRRLNKETQFATTIIHKYKGTTYTLLPNDKKYVFPIPDLEVQDFGLQQNDR